MAQNPVRTTRIYYRIYFIELRTTESQKTFSMIDQLCLCHSGRFLCEGRSKELLMKSSNMMLLYFKINIRGGCRSDV